MGLFRLLLLTSFVIHYSKAYGTAQCPDILIWENDTFDVYCNPLEEYEQVDWVREQFTHGNKLTSTNCYRSYVAQWSLENGKLYLTKLFHCDFENDSSPGNLKHLFPSKYFNGKVLADWVNRPIRIQKGKLVLYVHAMYESVYEKEIYLSFKNGIHQDTRTYDNSKSVRSDYTHNSDTLNQWIYSRINWELMPDLKDTTYKVVLQLYSGSGPGIDSVAVLGGTQNQILQEEATRVVSSIPRWDVYYKQGEVLQFRWTVTVVFSEENRLVHTR